MPRRLIITADDYGYADHIDQGIIRAAKANCLTTVSCFSNIPKEELKRKIKTLQEAKPDIGIGVHLTITSGFPIKKNLNSLISKKKKRRAKKRQPKGSFRLPGQHNFKKVDLKELKRELRAQIEQLAEVIGGVDKIDHFANHHGFLYFYEPFFKILIDLAEEYNIPIRSPLSWSKADKMYYYYKGQNRVPFSKLAIVDAAIVALPWKSWFLAAKGVGEKFIKKAIIMCEEKGVKHPYVFMDQIYGQPYLKDWKEYWGEIEQDEIIEQLHHLGSNYTDEDIKKTPSGVNAKYFDGRIDELNTLTSDDCQKALKDEQEKSDNPLILGTYRDFLDGQEAGNPEIAGNKEVV